MTDVQSTKVYEPKAYPCTASGASRALTPPNLFSGSGFGLDYALYTLDAVSSVLAATLTAHYLTSRWDHLDHLEGFFIFHPSRAVSWDKLAINGEKVHGKGCSDPLTL